MLRRARWLILLAIAILSGAVYFAYVERTAALDRDRPDAADRLPDNISATALDWEHDIKEGQRTKVNIRARNFQQIKKPSTFLLEGLQMRIFAKDGKTYDLVKSERASFDTGAGVMYSEGDVEITMRLPEEGQPAGRMVRILSSGMTFEVQTSKVWTDRHATFEFDKGDGEATGASYDPNSRELVMNSAVKLNWRGSDPTSPPIHVETAALSYRELTQEIDLRQWSKLQRGTMTMNAGDARVYLKNGVIERIDAANAVGVDEQPKRKLDYRADHVVTYFTPKVEIREIDALENARLDSTTSAGVTTVTTNRLDLDFNVTDKGSLLTKALASGKSQVTSDPAARGTSNPPTRVLRSDVIELAMRANGEEIERVVTHSPAEVEFIPKRAGERSRRMNADRMTMEYAEANALKTVHGVKDVYTRTEAPAPKNTVRVSETRSAELLATFDPKTGQMTTLKQWTGFEYDEGERHARAVQATMDSTRDLLTLESQARIWDDTGSTTADTIVMRQSTGDMTATGNVSSTRQPDKRDQQRGMIRGDEALRAQAQRMTTVNQNRLIRYEGNAVMWQGANHLRAQTIEIDRDKGTLSAEKDVVSTMPEEKPGKGQVLTVIRSDSMLYRDETKLALFRGNAQLEKPGMNVTSRQLRLWFREEKDSQGGARTELDRMFGDGAVEVAEHMPGRTRKGSGEHLEYHMEEERMVLNGGNPVVIDSKSGTSRGREITWFARQDRLIVDNTGSGPSVSRIPRK